MKSKLFLFSVLFTFIFHSCTKEKVTNNTIKEKYNPEQIKIYGKWKLINENPSSLKEEFYIFDSITPFLYYLSSDEIGFKNYESAVYTATKNTLIFNSVYVYEVNNDTLIIKSAPDNEIIKLLKTNRTDVDLKTWMSKSSTLLISKALPEMNNENSGSIAFNGNFIFFNSNYTGNNWFYKYNVITNSVVDSLTNSGNVSACYKTSTNEIYVASNYSSSSPLVKIKDFTNVGGSLISVTNFDYAKNLSYNPNSGVIYVYQNGILFSGSEGGVFSELFATEPLGVNIAQINYYTNDEFLTLRDNKIHRVKIAPSFKVLESYEPIKNFVIFSVSTNGSEVWVYGRNEINNLYEFRKISI